MQHHHSSTDSACHHAHHDHSHHHHHHHHADPGQMGTIYIVAIVINILFVAAETVAGLMGHSMGLLSDAGHNLSDVFCLLLALVAFKLSQTHATKRFTYGYRKSSILISLLNAIILLVAVGGIVVESIRKISHPAPVDGALVTWTAAAAIVVNGFTAWMLSRRQHDINTRGAFLHMLADTLVSAGVVVSGIVITHTGWTLIDPLMGLVIAAVILVSTWQLLSESLRMSVDAVPEDIDPDAVVALMKQTDGVLDIHHLHIWPISTTETALTAHVVIADCSQLDTITHALKTPLAAHGIAHSTLELETPASHCDPHDCWPPRRSRRPNRTWPGICIVDIFWLFSIFFLDYFLERKYKLEKKNGSGGQVAARPTGGCPPQTAEARTSIRSVTGRRRGGSKKTGGLPRWGALLH